MERGKCGSAFFILSVSSSSCLQGSSLFYGERRAGAARRGGEGARGGGEGELATEGLSFHQVRKVDIENLLRIDTCN